MLQLMFYTKEQDLFVQLFLLFSVLINNAESNFQKLTSEDLLLVSKNRNCSCILMLQKICVG